MIERLERFCHLFIAMILNAVETTIFSRAYLDFTNVLLIAESKGSNGFFSPMSE